MGRDDQGARARRRGVIDIGASCDQMCRGVDIALAGREEHGRVAALHDVEYAGRVEACGSRVDSPWQGIRPHLDVGSEGDQRGYDVRVPLRHRPHQCGLTARPFPGVHVRPVINEPPRSVR